MQKTPPPKFTLTPTLRKRIIRCAKAGVGVGRTALAIGVKVSTFRAWLWDACELQDAQCKEHHTAYQGHKAARLYALEFAMAQCARREQMKPAAVENAANRASEYLDSGGDNTQSDADNILSILRQKRSEYED